MELWLKCLMRAQKQELCELVLPQGAQQGPLEPLKGLWKVRIPRPFRGWCGSGLSYEWYRGRGRVADPDVVSSINEYWAGREVSVQWFYGSF